MSIEAVNPKIIMTNAVIKKSALTQKVNSGLTTFANRISPNGVNATQVKSTPRITATRREGYKISESFFQLRAVLFADLLKNGVTAFSRIGTTDTTKGCMVTVQNRVSPNMAASLTSNGQDAHVGTKKVSQTITPEAATKLPTKMEARLPKIKARHDLYFETNQPRR